MARPLRRHHPIGRVSPQPWPLQHEANVYITNTTDGTAHIKLFHQNDPDGTQNGSWTASPGETVGPMTVRFETGWGSYGILDWWSVIIAVEGGSTPGIYQNSGTTPFPHWKECQLQSRMSTRTSPSRSAPAASTSTWPPADAPTRMTRLGEFSKITNVFVLMLENRSFDNLFGQSGIPGITHATPADSNAYQGVTYPVGSPAPDGHAHRPRPRVPGRRQATGRAERELPARRPLPDHQPLRVRRQLRHHHNRRNAARQRRHRQDHARLRLQSPAVRPLPASDRVRDLRPLVLVAARADLAQPVLRPRRLVGRPGPQPHADADGRVGSSRASASPTRTAASSTRCRGPGSPGGSTTTTPTPTATTRRTAPSSARSRRYRR